MRVATAFSATDRTSSTPLEWVATGGFIALILAIMMLRHGYEGITHDAELYSFQAMAHLKPALLGNDLFLRFGSQDNYTLFSPLYAAAIALFGWEPAAALITLISQIAFLVSAWCLVRCVASREVAWLSVAILAALPGVYGAGSVWNYLEGFVTPRLASQALVLAAVTTMLAGHRWWMTVACLLAAALLHPLMAASGFAMAVLLWLMPFRRATVVGLAVAVSAGIALALAAAWAFPSLQLGADWLALVQERQSFLFVTHWHAQDWARLGVHFTVLAVGVVLLPAGSPSRRLCGAALLIALVGLLMSWLGADVLHFALIIQAQAWRWVWPAAVFSALLAPVIAVHCWKQGTMGKLTICLLIVAWLAVDEPYTIIVGPLAIAAAAATRWQKLPSDRALRLMLIGALALLAVVIARSLANAFLVSSAQWDQTPVPEFMRHLRDYSRDGLLPCVIVVGAWLLLTRSRRWQMLTAASCALACVALLPASAAEWQLQKYPAQDFEAFAPWRAQIPPGQEVFWIEGSVETWAMLERPRYLTNNQMASVLFSAGSRAELRRRARQLAPFAEHEPYIFWDEDRQLVRKDLVETLETLCSAIDAPFIVSRTDLAPVPLESTPTGASARYRGLKLFKCAR